MKYNINALVDILSYTRAENSIGEKKFIKKYIDSIPGIAKDKFGNRFIKVGNSDTCFACHTDTVHTEPYKGRTGYYAVEGSSKKFKKIQFGGKKYLVESDGKELWKIKKDGEVFPVESFPYNIAEQSFSNERKGRQQVFVKGKWAYKHDNQPLGADDGTGCWILLNLIYARVPGLYIFHRGEEHGGKGSHYIANRTPELLKNIKKVISFDRKGYSDVITYQRGSRCCSDEFAVELSKRLGGSYRPDSTGVFTDSANYVYLVPECTNVSMGYFHGHSKEEMQDLVFAENLMHKLLKIDWSTLPVVRVLSRKYSYGSNSNHSYGSYYSFGSLGGLGGLGGIGNRNDPLDDWMKKDTYSGTKIGIKRDTHVDDFWGINKKTTKKLKKPVKKTTKKITKVVKKKTIGKKTKKATGIKKDWYWGINDY